VKLQAGQIIAVDWRRDPVDPRQVPHPPEPNKLRPGVVLQPTSTNGCTKESHLLPQSLTCEAKTRITAATDSRITPAELRQVRQLVVLAIGGIS